jgi:hypothetical protein
VEPIEPGAVAEAEEASDEMMAALAAGGTYSFTPEPDEDELLPGGPDDEVAEAPPADEQAGEDLAAAAR